MESAILESLDASAWNTAELDQINAQFHGRSAQELLDWATSEFGDQIALTCSFSGASGMVLLDMVARLGRGTPVIFLDTDLLFPETYALAEAAARRYGVAIQLPHPALTLDEQAFQQHLASPAGGPFNAALQELIVEPASILTFLRRI